MQRLIFKYRLATTNMFTTNPYDVYIFLGEFLSQMDQDNCKDSVIKTYGINDILSHKTVFKIFGDFLLPFFVAVDDDINKNIKQLILNDDNIMGGLSMFKNIDKEWIIQFYDNDGIIIKTYKIDETNICKIFLYTKDIIHKMENKFKNKGPV